MKDPVIYLTGIPLKELIEKYGKEYTNIAIKWGKKKDWFDVIKHKETGEVYLAYNPSIGGMWLDKKSTEEGRKIEWIRS